MAMGAISIIVGVVLLILLKVLVKDEDRGDRTRIFHGIDHGEFFKEEPEFDPTWSLLPSNVLYSDDD